VVGATGRLPTGAVPEIQQSVREVFVEETPRLLALRVNPAPPLLERVAVSVGKRPCVRIAIIQSVPARSRIPFDRDHRYR